jgi:hypothetical protein
VSLGDPRVAVYGRYIFSGILYVIFKNLELVASDPMMHARLALGSSI